MKLKIKKLDPNAVVPARAHEGDAGLDLYAVAVSPAFKRVQGADGKWGNAPFEVFVDFGIAVEIPPGYVGKIYARSSIYKTCLRLSNGVGVIDSGYRGELKAVFDVLEGAPSILGMPDWEKACAQLVIEKLPDVKVEVVEELSDSERGKGGFGSTDHICRVRNGEFEKGGEK